MAPRPQSLALLALLASAIISQSAALRSLRLADEAAGGTIAATSGDDAAFYDDRVELLLYIRSRCSGDADAGRVPGRDDGTGCWLLGMMMSRPVLGLVRTPEWPA